MNAQKAEYWLSNFAANTPADCRTRTEEAGIALLPELVKLRQSRAEVSEQTHRIATLTAERDAQDAKVRELVDAVLKERDLQAQSNGYISCAIDDVYELAQTLAAQLKETSNE